MDIAWSILESTPRCVVVLDGELKVVYGNGNFLAFIREDFGAEIEFGKSILNIIPDDRRLRYKLRLDEVLSGQCSRAEESFIVNGEPRYFDVAYHPLNEGGKWSKVVVTFEDITARKRREIRILEQEALMREQIATQETLLSVISHDLRSPIFQLNGLLFLIRQASSQRDDARLQMHAEDLEERISHLTHTLDNLLSWSNLQRKSLEPQVTRFKVQPIFDHAIGLLRPGAQRKAIHLYTRRLAGIELCSDREMVAFLARNLINNAIKFSQQAGRIEVEGREGTGFFSFSVIDHGVGMDPEKISHLREGSEQSSSTGTWGERGTGLGLKLCFEFVDRLGGSLQIASTRNKGTTVTVTLPQLPVPVQGTPPSI